MHDLYSFNQGQPSAANSVQPGRPNCPRTTRKGLAVLEHGRNRGGVWPTCIGEQMAATISRRGSFSFRGKVEPLNTLSLWTEPCPASFSSILRVVIVGLTDHSTNGRKVKIVRRLRPETTMTLKWIAERLKMGTWTRVANRLYHTKGQSCANTQDPFFK